jgi:hypothetical protein
MPIARRPGSNAVVRLATAEVSTPVIAADTLRATRVPAAPSKWAKPSANAG